MPFLIDGDVLIDVSRGNAAAIEYVDRLTDRWVLSQVTAMELMSARATSGTLPLLMGGCGAEIRRNGAEGREIVTFLVILAPESSQSSPSGDSDSSSGVSTSSGSM
jgi:predicted nucleic acid-binding protein